MRHLIILVGVICLVFLVLPSCAPAPEPQQQPEETPSTEADMEAYQAMIKKWDAAFKAKDADGLAALYTDDAVRMVPNQPAWIGKEAIRAGFAAGFESEGFDQYTIEVENMAEGVVVSGEWSIIRGIGKATWSPQGGGEPIHTTAKYMSLNQRQPDGSWKIVWDIWNADMPLPATPAT